METFYQYSIPSLWLAWFVYWRLAAFRAKTTRRLESLGSRLSHTMPLALGIALLATEHVPFDWLAARLLPQRPGWFWLGFCLAVLGLGFAVAARVWLGRNWSSMVTLKEDHELIRSGPYRWVRHPIYTGLLMAVLGSCMARDEWRGPVVLALVTGAFARKIAVEERFMIDQFGCAYLCYRDEVPSLLPLPGRYAAQHHGGSSGRPG